MYHKRIGIEAINLYGGSLCLDQADLALARGLDPDKVVRDFMIDTRSLNPPYEDVVTMGANAAKPLLEKIDRDAIGLLIVGTESSVDFGKPISTNIHGLLDLPPNIRNFETKHACYSGIAGLDTALNWLAAGLNRGRKALVIATDFSRMHLNSKEEFVMGGVATAIVLSDRPKVIEFELERRGTWTTDVFDTFRPSARHEIGNNELSLYTYIESVGYAYEDYCRAAGREIDFESDFGFISYHTPFTGIALQAHRTLCNQQRRYTKQEIRADFDRRVMPCLRYSRLVGSTYSASNLVGLCSLAMSVPDLKPGTRVGFFAYGSGAISEFYSGLLCPEAHETVAAMGIDEALAARHRVDVEEYEQIERLRDSYIENQEFTADTSIPTNWYERHYVGKGLWTLEGVHDFRRVYKLN